VAKDSFKALVLDKKDGKVQAEIRRLQTDALSSGDVLVSVAYSSLNYKDGLAVTGRGPVIRRYPMVPGIDLAGTVVESKSLEFRPGDQVLVTGCGIGEDHWGGYAEMARKKAEWLVRLPEGLTLQEAMGIGTAGFTAMLSVMALEERGLKPGGREVLVTGAAGGVGSMAVAILSGLGYRVVASTGRLDEVPYLKALGASRIVPRSDMAAASDKGLEHERWAGAVDSVGGDTLAAILRALEHGAGVAVCGLAGGSTLQTTVFPFILRGAALLGIASSTAPRARRLMAWERVARDLPREALHRIMQPATLEDLPDLSRRIVEGTIRGRVVIDLTST
jgi:acrylyl-CoA reductase (NADPH)